MPDSRAPFDTLGPAIVKIVLIGRPLDVQAVADRLRQWYTVLAEQGDYARQDEPGHVERRITVKATGRK